MSKKDKMVARAEELCFDAWIELMDKAPFWEAVIVPCTNAYEHLTKEFDCPLDEAIDATSLGHKQAIERVKVERRQRGMSSGYFPLDYPAET